MKMMSKQTRSKKVYFNDAQRYLLHLGANQERIIASRRFGKSDGIAAPRILRNVQHMPRSAGAIYGATFKQILTRTLPAAVAALERMGYKHEVHYFIGRKAPKSMGFETPVINPSSYEHVMHWYNGSIAHMLSQDVKFSANSLTLDWYMADEARSLRKEKLFEELIPAVSGLVGRFENCPWHKSGLLISDMPTNKTGEWLIDEESKMDKELIHTLEGTIGHINELNKQPEKYAREIIKQQKERDFLRKRAFLYKEFDAIDNLEILGEDYIREMKRALTPLIFRISILNHKIRQMKNGFYPNLNPDVHYYDAFNNDYFLNLRTPKGSLDVSGYNKETCIQDRDVDPSQPLNIAFDYNANINWIVTGQSRDGKMYTLSSKFVKYDKKLRELCNLWSDYYQPHSNRDLNYYYDATAKQSSYAVSSENFADIVYQTLTRRKWNVNMIDIGKTIEHKLKHQYINDALTGRQYLFPLFNRENNEFLLPALEQAGIKVGRNGFEKDKSGEKYPESADDPLELRTDGTDAWDTLFIGMNFYPASTYMQGLPPAWG
jgi:hypothetical protein